MSWQIFAGGGAALLVLLLSVFGLHKKAVSTAEEKGKTEGELTGKLETQQKVDAVVLEQASTEAKQVEQANEIRDRLQSDPDYADSVRERFTRPAGDNPTPDGG